MTTTHSGLPRHRVPFAAPAARTGEVSSAWIDPLLRADGSVARDRTQARLTHDGSILSVAFRCEDRHIWGTFTRRDDPLWQEEVVELFLAPGLADPVEYFEFEVSPKGILFDAKVRNPHSRRDELEVDPSWNCAGIEWAAEIDRSQRSWRAELHVPLKFLSAPPVPLTWRANLFRIERPAGEPAEFSCWSPTHVEPPDFHKPNRFGFLELAGPDVSPAAPEGRRER